MLDKGIKFLLILMAACFTGYGKTDSLIALSDIHFQPFLQKMSYTTDCDTGLFLSAVNSIKKTNPNPKYILIPGDFICHGVVDSAEKTNIIHFIAATLKNNFRHSIILPALGNNDTYAGDYEMKDNDLFYKMFFASFFNGNGNSINTPFYNRAGIGGYYAYRSGVDDKLTIIVLNTTLFSHRKKAKTSNEFGDTELNWLDSILHKCKADNQNVWLIYHIPPGADGFMALEQGDSADLWHYRFYKQFLNEIEAYHTIIKIQLAGHTHLDDFRVIYEGEAPLDYIHIVPGVTPIHQNNPAYQQLFYDTKTYELTDYQTYYSPDPTRWTTNAIFKKEYDFTDAYKMNLSANNLAGIKDNDNKATLFKHYYSAGKDDPAQIDNPNWSKFFNYTKIYIPTKK